MKFMYVVKRASLATIIALSMCMTGISTVKAETDCYKDWYVTSECSSCDDSSYNNTQTDSCSGKHPRQNGIKLCSTHLKTVSTSAAYYKRGFSDYNCLAYALGKNGVQSWTWPEEWGRTGPTLEQFKTYISKKGYRYATTPSQVSGKKIIYVYAENGHVKHFARKYTLDGNTVSGAATISKWGACSLYTTSDIDPYTTDSGYGKLVLICYK